MGLTFNELLEKKEALTLQALAEHLRDDSNLYNSFCDALESLENMDTQLTLVNLLSNLISSSFDICHITALLPSIIWNHFIMSSKKIGKSLQVADELLISILCHKSFLDKMVEFERLLPVTPLVDGKRGIYSNYNQTCITCDDFYQIRAKLTQKMIKLTVNSSQLATGRFGVLSPECYISQNFKMNISERFANYENIIKYIISMYGEMNSYSIIRFCLILSKFSRCGYNKNYFSTLSTTLLSEMESISLFKCGIPRPCISPAFIKKSVFFLFLSWYRHPEQVETCIHDLEIVCQSRMMTDGVVAVEALKTFIKTSDNFLNDQSNYVFVLPPKRQKGSSEESIMN